MLSLTGQCRQMRARLFKTPLERALAPERGRTGARPYPGTVLRHPVELEHPLMHQHRQHLAHQLVQRRPGLSTEVAERMVVHAHPAADPAIRRVRFAQPFQLARAVHPFAELIQQPQRQQDSRIGGIAARATLARFDRLIEARQINCSSTRQIACAGCAGPINESRSSALISNCLRLGSRSRTASSTGPPPRRFLSSQLQYKNRSSILENLQNESAANIMVFYATRPRVPIASLPMPACAAV